MTGSPLMHPTIAFLLLTFYLVLVLLLFCVFPSNQINGYPSSHLPGYDSSPWCILDEDFCPKCSLPLNTNSIIIMGRYTISGF